MPRIFISHASANNAEALALRDWLVARGWDDLFLDIDPQRGLVSGQRWLDRLQASAQSCKAVLFVLSRAWLASRYCLAELWEARKQERPLFALVIDDTAVEEVPAEMRGVWQLAFLTRGSRFESFEVLPPPAYSATVVRFSHEGLESLRLGLAQAGLTSFETASFPWPAPGFEKEADGTTPRRPYRGLKPIDFPDAGVFFGRDADLVRARDHLADLRDRGGRCLVVLLGASGSGKSSFLRAGLLPRLARDDHRFLPLPIVRPRGAAMWGDEGLLAALETAHRLAGLAATRAALRSDLEAAGAGLLRRLADLRSTATGGLQDDAKPPTLIIPIDQAEELFMTVRGDQPGETGAAEAAFFLARLAEILHRGPEAIALATMRTDAYEPLQTAQALAGVPQEPFNLPALVAAAYRSVIEGPARRAGDAGRTLKLEPQLIEALPADAQGADALPLLSFTLERLYVEHWGDAALSLADYEALGGVQGSIEAAVAEAFANPEADPRVPAGATERETLLKRAFVPHLMGVNEANGEPVRRTARQGDLPAEARGLIERLIERRLLVVDRRQLEGSAGEAVIEVAHEALLRLWPTLRRWHDQERDALITHQEIGRAAAAWNQNACGADWLTHRGTRLAEAEAVARREDFSAVFAGRPRAYIDACRQAEDAAREAENRRLGRQRTMQRRIGVLLSVLAIVTLSGGGLVLFGRRDLARQTSKVIATNAKENFEAGFYDRAMRLALVASQDSWFAPRSVDAETQLGRATYFSRMEAQLTNEFGLSRYATFSSDGKHIITSCLDTACMWTRNDDGTWRSSFLEGRPPAELSASFSPDGVRIVTAGGMQAYIGSQREGATRTWVALVGHQGPVFAAAFSPDGTRIVTASGDKTARVWRQRESGAWQSVPLEGHHDSVFSAEFSPDGTHIVTASKDKTARVWSESSHGLWTGVALEGHRDEVRSAKFSPDGTLIVTASRDRTARVWSQADNGAWSSTTLEHSKDKLNAASFSPDGTHIVTASRDRTVRVWSRSKSGTWTSVILKGHQGEVLAVSFSPDGSRILTASLDGTSRVWKRGENGDWFGLGLGAQQDSVDAKAFFVKAFSPDDTRIFAASNDGHTRMWSRGESVAWTSVALEELKDPIRSAAFSPSGDRIVTTVEDGTAREWNFRWLMGPGDWERTERLSLPEAVCREKLRGSWAMISDAKAGRHVARIAERLLTAADINSAPILAGHLGDDVCAPFLEHRSWWSRLAFWR